MLQWTPRVERVGGGPSLHICTWKSRQRQNALSNPMHWQISNDVNASSVMLTPQQSQCQCLIFQWLICSQKKVISGSANTRLSQMQVSPPQVFTLVSQEANYQHPDCSSWWQTSRRSGLLSMDTLLKKQHQQQQKTVAMTHQQQHPFLFFTSSTLSASKWTCHMQRLGEKRERGRKKKKEKEIHFACYFF